MQPMSYFKSCVQEDGIKYKDPNFERSYFPALFLFRLFSQEYTHILVFTNKTIHTS